MIMRIVVDLPDPFGPRNPVTITGRDLEGQVVHRRRRAVPLGQGVCRDHHWITVRTAPLGGIPLVGVFWWG